MQKYIYFQFEMAPAEHIASLLNRDLNKNPKWELVSVFTMPHLVQGPGAKLVTANGKPNAKIIQMGCPIYRVKEEDSETMPKAPQGLDTNGNIITGPDLPAKLA